MRRRRLSAAAWLLHASFVLVAAGALLTRLTGERGTVRIGAGDETEAYVDASGDSVPLPFAIGLSRFEIEYYPGGTVPRDYVSHVVTRGDTARVSMNKVLEVEGYRFCQSGYGPGGSTVLSVRRDRYGMPLVYTGYALFAVAGLLVMLSPRGRFRRLLRALCLLAFLGAGFTGASASCIAGVPREAADSLRPRQVVYQGRLMTFNSLARDVVTKLHGSPSYRDLSPEQTLLSLRLYPLEWRREPLIKVTDGNLRARLGIEGRYASLSDLFDSVGAYRLIPLLEKSRGKERRAVEELDEKAGIVLSLFAGDLVVKPAKDDGRLPEWRVRLELLYNDIPFGTVRVVLLFSASLAAFLAVAGIRRMRGVACGLLWAAFAVSSCCFVMEWVLSGHVPLSNTYDTLCFAVIVLEALSLALLRRSLPVAALGMLLGATLSVVARLVAVNPVVTPLMPVLHSPWLSLHVSLVMASYALLGLTCMTALAGLCSPANARRMRDMSLTFLYPAEWLLGLGIITGSVWAEVSWGSYWSWDPKENWALVTFVAYALPLHPSVGMLRKPRHYHLYMLFAISLVAMTYFGVNLLDSRHGY